MRQIASNSTDKQAQANTGTVVLNGHPVPVVGPVRVQDLARFQSKITFGDPSHDSDPLLSTYNMSSFTGGIGNEQLKEGVDDETYWTGTLETRWPGQISLLPYTWEFDGPTGAASQAFPLADFPSDAPSLWCAFDTTLTKWDSLNRLFVSVGTLAASPVNKAVEYNNLLYIPLGTTGYATVDKAGTITNVTTGTDFLPVTAFCLWDNKLAALTTTGQLRLRFGALAWEAANDALTLPSAAVPRNLVVFINQQNTPTLHLISNIGVWAYDRDAVYLYRTHLQFPAHPDQGRASVNWRGEAMYVSVGLGIHTYNGGIIASMGPDGRYGLPDYLRGVITSLEGEYNSLLCLVEGQRKQDANEVQDAEIVSPMYMQDIRPYRETNARSVLLRFVSHGWHPVWESPEAGGTPTWVHVSRADNGYLLWWGFNGRMYHQKLPYTFHNPKQGLKAGVDTFAGRGSLTTGWFDADMIAFDKLASHIELLMDDPLGNGMLGGDVTIYYETGESAGFQYLGKTTYVGRTVMPFNVGESEGSTDFSFGLKFRRIRFRIDVARTPSNAWVSPFIRSVMLKFIKLPLSQLSFSFNVDLTQDREFMGQGVGTLAEYLRRLASGDQYSELTHGGDTYRVRISQTNSSEATGYDLRNTIDVTAVEIKVPDHEWVLPATSEAT